MKDPIFICGHRKSGTTMFHNLFDGHNELLVYPSDLNLLYAYFPVYLSDNYSDNERLERLDIVLFKDLEFQLKNENLSNAINIQLFREFFFESLENSDLCDMKIIITKLMEAFSKVMDKPNRIPVIKETSIEIYSNEIFNWFPNAKFLHLVRDPRDNYAALKSGVKKYYSKMGEDEKQTLASLIYRTRFGLEMGLANINKYGKEKYIFVNFTQLVNNIDAEIKEIIKFLGISFKDSLLVPTRLGNEIKGNNFDGNKFNTVNNKNIGRWSERISEEEAKVIEFHLGELMKQFEFDLKFDYNDSAIIAAEFYKWQNYKYFFSDRFLSL
ncbi:sulfotransferase family protein [Tenacibaculum ovolyticum]|uniref:sulfotransferase family protein n=1 Tax=Tenacibaculum ovolyticum TaxID=104270 RepID=UPI001F3A9290|nr:sulfotransferase [Tenacibaculum ovolyticum]